MQIQGKALRVVIYIGESNRYRGAPLYKALLEMLKENDASGATVVRGLAGFGAHSRIRTATVVTLSADLPIRVEWVDTPERVERLLPRVRGMVDDGLITVEEVQVVQYASGRQPDPLAQPVADVMRTEVTAVAPNAPAAEVIRLLLQQGYRSVPVVARDGHLVGIITDGDLLRQTDLYARLDVLASLPPAQLQEQLATLKRQATRAADIMTQPVITVSADESLRRAVTLMVKHGLKRLPVVDERQLVGWVSRVDILRVVEYHQQAEEPLEDGPHSGATVAELMYQDVTTVRPDALLEEIVTALETSRRRRAVVVDDAQHVLGIITDGDLLRRSRRAEHPGLLARLRHLLGGQREETTAVLLPDEKETALELMTSPVITITTRTTLPEALQIMLQHRIKRLPVVDEEGRLVGLLGRASLLHGLLQAADSLE